MQQWESDSIMIEEILRIVSRLKPEFNVSHFPQASDVSKTVQSLYTQ